MRKLDSGDGRQLQATLTIKIWSDGALSVEGPIDDPLWCLAVLDNAREAVKNHQHRTESVIIPGKDVSL